MTNHNKNIWVRSHRILKLGRILDDGKLTLLRFSLNNPLRHATAADLCLKGQTMANLKLFIVNPNLKFNPKISRSTLVTLNPWLTDGVNSGPNTLHWNARSIYFWTGRMFAFPPSLCHCRWLRLSNWWVCQFFSKRDKIQTQPFFFPCLRPIFLAVRQLSHENNERDKVENTQAYLCKFFSQPWLQAQSCTLSMLSSITFKTPILSRL